MKIRDVRIDNGDWSHTLYINDVAKCSFQTTGDFLIELFTDLGYDVSYTESYRLEEEY